jgi:hypothetical protein
MLVERKFKGRGLWMQYSERFIVFRTNYGRNWSELAWREMSKRAQLYRGLKLPLF